VCAITAKSYSPFNLTYSQKHAFIGFYSKRRKTTMQVIHLGQKELAQRWRMSEATLERWRSDGKGPVAYFSPSWTAFQAERGRHFSVIVDGISN
jgi:hypothetical protein